MFRVAKRFVSTSRVLLTEARPGHTAINPEEQVHFNELAKTWWDIRGPQRILHKMNLLRMDYIQQTIRENILVNADVTDPEKLVYVPPFSTSILPEPIAQAITQEQENAIQSRYSELKLKALDIGCGGGILTESLSRLSIVESVKGIDLSPDVIKIADLHKKSDPITEKKITYQLQPLEDVPIEEKYDIVTVMEMLEHVDYPAEVLKEALKHVKVGGWLFLSTINRDLVSWFTTIFMGEHVLRIVPVGTHHLNKYIKQTEIRDWFADEKDRFRVASAKGCMYVPACGWVFTDTPNIGNYLMAIQRVK